MSYVMRLGWVALSCSEQRTLQANKENGALPVTVRVVPSMERGRVLPLTCVALYLPYQE